VVIWKWEDEDEKGAWGPVWIDAYGDDPQRPISEEKWDRWALRTEAEEFARSNGFEFQEG
jgi:hypothetical protein